MCRLLAYLFLSVVIILPCVTMLGFTSVSIGFVAHLHIVRVEYEVTDLRGDALNLPYKKWLLKAGSVREQILVHKYKVELVLGVIIARLSVMRGHNMPLMTTDLS